jgi:hypothetical protein
MRDSDPSSHVPAPFSTRGFNPQISSTPSRCSQCSEYSSRIADLETRLSLAKYQAQMAIKKASLASGYMKKISSLEEKVSSLTVKVVHNEECESFILGIVESACELLRREFSCDFFFWLCVYFCCDIFAICRYLLGFCC